MIRVLRPEIFENRIKCLFENVSEAFLIMLSSGEGRGETPGSSSVDGESEERK